MLNKMQLVKESKNVLYCDIDSIMYAHNKECELPENPIRSSIGEITNALPRDAFFDKFWVLRQTFFCLSENEVKSGLIYNVFKVEGMTWKRAAEKTFIPQTLKNYLWARLVNCEALQPV